MDALTLPQPEGCTVRRHLDADLARSVHGLVEVDRAVRGYRRRLEEDDWPDWVGLLPEAVREMLIGNDVDLPF